jgi:transcriptional regulator with XRE-family HTH domain
MKQAADRLRALRKRQGLSRRALAERVGCAESYITKLERGERRLKAEWIQKLARGLGVESKDFFTNGMDEGPDLVLAPIVGWSSAGAPAEAVEQIAEDYVPIPYKASSVRAVRNVGHSMNRVAPDGAILVFDYEDKELVDKKLYLFRIDGETTFKRYRSSDGPKRLEPDSTLPEYKTLYPIGEIDVIGRVVYIAQAV